MTTAAERNALNIGHKPRHLSPSIPSRSTSLKFSRAPSRCAESNPAGGNRSASIKATGETLIHSSDSTPTLSRRQSLRGDTLDLVSGYMTPPVNMRRGSSRSSCSYSTSKQRSTSCAASMRNPRRPAKVQRWAGATNTVSDWDGLRRDPELWFEDGDCLVHLYARGQSQRGPSFCVPFQVLKQSKCGSMFSLCFAQMSAVSGTSSLNVRRASSGFSTPVKGLNRVELFVPAPDDASREVSFKWHLTTRNFFAFIFGKPLVGHCLGQAFVDLQERMHLFRSGQINNHRDFFAYAEIQGYRDYVDRPDYALAMLFYAEHYKLREVWIDAFAHCVGMNESLAVSPEFEPLSRLTKALITRACLEMDIQLGRVTVALRNFLEGDLSPACLGLTEGARAHLDRFRSFLHSFYVEKFGYWPPPTGSPFSKVLYKSLYYDFKNLYDYLVDLESTLDITTQKPASGGLCVLQNVNSFDKRHNFSSLPHPLPLVPDDVPLRKRTESQRSLKALTLGSKQGKTDRYLSARAALTSATNNHDVSVTSCPIVQAYMRFERQCALNNREEKVSMADARKVRWLLIYGTLQYLVSALRAPKEVRDVERAEYPLCCLVTEQSPWQAGTKVLNSPLTHSVNLPEAISSYLSESKGAVSAQLTPVTSISESIQPDCQRQDYFSHTNVDASSHPVSVEVPAPLKISQPNRNSSIRSFRRLSLSSRGSRRNSMQLKTTAHCDILVPGYGNGLNTTVSEPPSLFTSRFPSQASSRVPSRRPSLSDIQSETSLTPRPSALRLDCDVPQELLRTPVVESFRMDEIVSPAVSHTPQRNPSCSDSATSSDTPFWSDEASSTSSKSSTYEELLERKTSPAEESGLLGGLVPIVSTPPMSSAKTTPKSSQPTSPSAPCRRSEFRFSFDKQTASFPDHQSSPASIGANSSIGIALSGPPLPPPRAVFNSDGHPTTSKSRTFSRSISIESLPVSKFAQLSPLRMHPTPSVEGTKDEVDILSALSSLPSNSSEADRCEPSGRSGSDCSHSILDAIPPPIARAKKSSKKTSQASGSKVISEEERKKKEKRKSFWRR